MDFKNIANEIIENIICDISMRSGLGDKWEEIDEETKEEIKEEWNRLIIKEFKYGFKVE